MSQLGLLAHAQVTLAAPQASVEPGANGMVRVVGNGWRPGDQLALTLGQNHYDAFVDSAGGFDVATGLPRLQGALAVHHVARMEATTITSPPASPLAIWFAQSVLMGAAYVGALACLGLVARQVLRRRYAARHDSWPRDLARPAQRR